MSFYMESTTEVLYIFVAFIHGIFLFYNVMVVRFSDKPRKNFRTKKATITVTAASLDMH